MKIPQVFSLQGHIFYTKKEVFKTEHRLKMNFSKGFRHFLGKLECLETVRVGIDADNTIFLRANLLTLPIVSSNCDNIQFI
uniref:Uncharacterized protein n=2 Tax=Brassica oleracea TaxID=3712 RepID=A0A0D2ZSJ3_BRAOL|nr:unnamed protein product [Brassica oleracea]